MANEEKQIMDLLMPLDKMQKIAFGVICIRRVLTLYQLFDNKYDISIQDKSLSGSKGFDKLDAILNFIESELAFSSKEQVEDLIKKYINLVPDSELFDLNAVVYIAQLIAQSVLNILRFYLTGDTDYILFCTSANLEIINQIKTDQYYKDKSISESLTEREYLDNSFSREMEIEKSCIGMIKEGKAPDVIHTCINQNGFIISGFES